MRWKGAKHLILDCSTSSGFGALSLTWPLQSRVAHVCGSPPKKNRGRFDQGMREKSCCKASPLVFIKTLVLNPNKLQ